MLYKVLMFNLAGFVVCNAVPQDILVNGMLLPIKPTKSDEPYQGLAEYTFNDGDLVDVTCGNPVGQICVLKMDYIFTENYLTEPHGSFEDPVGFKLRMGAHNNDTNATCTCSTRNAYNEVVRVHFVQRNSPIDNPVIVYINDTALRPTNNNRDTYEYMYKPFDHLNVTCDSTIADEKAVFTSIPPHQDDGASTRILKLNNKSESFQCATPTKLISVKLTPRDLKVADNGCWMLVELKNLKALATPSLEIYRAKDRTLFYEYKENASFVLTCSGFCDQRLYDIDLIHSGGREIKTKKDEEHKKPTIITKTITISEIKADNVLQCRLKEKSLEVIMVRTLVFEPYVPPSTIILTTTTKSITGSTTDVGTVTPGVTPEIDNNGNLDGNGGTTWILVAVCIVAFIIIICVSTLIYKIKHRKNYMRNPQPPPGGVTYENLNNDSPIPPFPRQWESHYADPVDRAEDPAYCEPISGPRANIKNELYTMPVPKVRRKPANNQTTDPAYEELDVDRPAVVQNATDDPNYAEIVPGAFKNELNLLYARVLPKGEPQNLNRNDYSNVKGDSPNYAQVMPKSMRGKQLQSASSGKYANVHDERRYVNANTGSEYAEPAYCEPAYINRNKRK